MNPDMRTLCNHYSGRVDGLIRNGHVFIKQVSFNAQSAVHFPQPGAPEPNVLSWNGLLPNFSLLLFTSSSSCTTFLNSKFPTQSSLWHCERREESGRARAAQPATHIIGEDTKGERGLGGRRRIFHGHS